jgi:replication-associated recombination protein RarA
MQRAIRRGDIRLAGYWALELWASGYGNYVWKRLLTVSAEDCFCIPTLEVKALHGSYALVNQGIPAKQPKGRIFISKAVILLCAAKKNREADHLQNFAYDKMAGLDADKLGADLLAAEATRIRFRPPSFRPALFRESGCKSFFVSPRKPGPDRSWHPAV